MTKREKYWEYVLNILKDWEVCAIDVNTQSGGLLAIWNLWVCNLKPFKTCASILLKGKVVFFLAQDKYVEHL